MSQAPVSVPPITSAVKSKLRQPKPKFQLGDRVNVIANAAEELLNKPFICTAIGIYEPHLPIFIAGDLAIMAYMFSSVDQALAADVEFSDLDVNESVVRI